MFILDTDYYNYAILFTCSNYFGFINGQNLVVLGRRKSLEPVYMQRVMSIVTYNTLSTLSLKPMDQGCNNTPYPYNNVRKR